MDKKIKNILIIVSIIVFAAVVGMSASDIFTYFGDIFINPNEYEKVALIIFFPLFVIFFIVCFALIVGVACVSVASIWGIYFGGKSIVKNKKLIIPVIMGIVLVFSISYIASNYQKYDESEIGYLAYSNDNRKDFIIHIEEYGEYVPYLILQNDYNDEEQTLLLRLHVVTNGIDEEISQDGTFSMSSYDDNYSNTDISIFLNGAFTERFNENFLNIVAETAIMQRTYTGAMVGVLEGSKEKFFIPSCYELTGSVGMNEDKTDYLEYFKNNNMIATNDNLTTQPWWTRSISGDKAIVVDTNNTLKESYSENLYYIRPALVVPSNTKVKKITDDNSQEINIFDL